MQRRLALFAIGIVPLCALAQTASNLASFTYTQVPDGPAPCSGGNRANGINQRGDIVGRCENNSGPLAWVLPRGSTAPTLIDFSGAPFTPHGSTTRAINDRGDIVGRYFDSAGKSHGYLLSHSVFTTVDSPFPGTADTDARGVNDPGVIVGIYHVLTIFPPPVGQVAVPHGFVRDARGTFTAIDFPGANATTVQGINNSGDVVGTYVVLNPTTFAVAVHGYVLSQGVFTTIDVPFDGATATLVSGINQQGQIAGSYTTDPATLVDLLGEGGPGVAPYPHGFLRSSDGATFTHIDFPGAIGTDCRGGINDHGNVVGTFAFGPSLTDEHGFVTSR